MPQRDFTLAEETLGYVTSPEESNIDFRLLVDGSQNVLIDYQKKVKTRAGYTRLGDADTSLTAVRNAWTWKTSKEIASGISLPMRFYDDELEVYLSTIDGTALNNWYRVRNGWSTTERLRSCIKKTGDGGWFDTTEDLDLCVMVNGDDNLYAWNGAVAVVSSVTANTIKKAGTNTFAQNRFFVSGNKTLINVRTGTEFAYTGGESTTTLTGVTGSPVTDGMVAGDVLVQKVVTTADTPLADRNNHTIFNRDNQLWIGSEDASEVYVSSNSDYTDYTFSSPRVSGEGALLTLTNPVRGFGDIGEYILVFTGPSTIFRNNFQQLDVGGTLVETLEIKQINVGINQGALNQECIVPVGDQIFYISNEPALRAINDPEDLTGINPKNFSNPIKPDFDAEDWTNAEGFWADNILYFSSPVNSRLYMLNFVEDADGKLKRFWNPPQILPVRSFSVINSGTGNYKSNGEKLHFHSNGVPETYLAFDGVTDGNYDGIALNDKLPINAIAKFAYNNYKDRAKLKNFDEYFVYCEIRPNVTELTMTLNYDFGGITQQVEKIIDGSDERYQEGQVGINSLAQSSLATNPLGGLLNPPEDAKKWRRIFEIAKEDFHELQVQFSTNDVDQYWAIIAHGANTALSPRRPINKK